MVAMKKLDHWGYLVFLDQHLAGCIHENKAGLIKNFTQNLNEQTWRIPGSALI
jgi:hypothetical protein